MMSEINRRFFNDTKFAIACGICGFLTVAFFLCIFLLVKTVNEVTPESPADYYNSVTLMGRGEVLATSDIASFNFQVMETAESVEAAQNVATQKVNNIIAKLKERGIEDKDIKTTSYNVSPKYEWQSQVCPVGQICPEGRSVIVGYNVSQSVDVKVREVDQAGDLLTMIGQEQVSYVSNLQFSIDDEENLKAEARAKAITNAKAKAAELEKQLGVKLDDIISFYEEDDRYPMYDAYRMESYAVDGMGGASVKSSPDLPTGENTVSVNVSVTFKIEN